MRVAQAEEADTAVAAQVLAAFAAGQPVSVELLMCNRGGTRSWIQISFTPVLSEVDGTVDNHVSLSHTFKPPYSKYNANCCK